MRSLLLLGFLALALLLGTDPGPADAKPPFARREGRACGYCHINPRGGGARNARGLEYARNEFKFPPRKGNLSAFARERDRQLMIHARAMIDIDHVKIAISELKRLAKSAKGEAAKGAAKYELHELDVRGAEVLGAARRLLRKQEADQAVELLTILATEYKGLSVYEQARGDLRDLRKLQEYRDLIARERREGKARLMLLDSSRYRYEKKTSKAEAILTKIVKAYPESRAALAARKQLSKTKNGSK